MRMGIGVVVTGNGDKGPRRIVDAALAKVRAVADEAAAAAVPNVPRRTGWLQRTLTAGHIADGAVISAGKRHPGMANNRVRDRTRAAVNAAARAALERSDL